MAKEKSPIEKATDSVNHFMRLSEAIRYKLKEIYTEQYKEKFPVFTKSEEFDIHQRAQQEANAHAYIIMFRIITVNAKTEAISSHIEYESKLKKDYPTIKQKITKRKKK